MSLFGCLVIFVGLVKAFIYRGLQGFYFFFVWGGLCAKTTGNWSWLNFHHGRHPNFANAFIYRGDVCENHWNRSWKKLPPWQALFCSRNLCFFSRHLQPVVVVVVGFLVASPRAGMQQILTHRWLQSRDRLSWMWNFLEVRSSKSGKMQHLQVWIQWVYIYIHTSWWFQIFFKFSSRKLAKMNPFWRIFFRWVETTNQYTSIFDEVLCVGDTFDDVEKVICLTQKKHTLRWKRSRFQYEFSNLKGTCDNMYRSPSAAVVSHLYDDDYCSADDGGVVVSVNWFGLDVHFHAQDGLLYLYALFCFQLYFSWGWFSFCTSSFVLPMIQW